MSDPNIEPLERHPEGLVPPDPYTGKVASLVSIILHDHDQTIIARIKRNLQVFINTLLLNYAISPRVAEKLIEQGIVNDRRFQELLKEIGTHMILHGEAERLLLLIIDYPDIFRETDFMQESIEIQGVLEKRIQFLEENGQHWIVPILKKRFLKK